MTSTPLADLLAAVPSLNDPGQPFSYAVDGQKIVGTWDIVKATSLYPDEVTHVDRAYRLTVELDEEHHRFDFDEQQTSEHGSLGSGGLSWGTEGFKGKSTTKEFSFEFGGVNATDAGVSAHPVVYSFETSRIKDPLFGFLEQHGWEHEEGLLGRLFHH